jgi:chromosome segregation ATPase
MNIAHILHYRLSNMSAVNGANESLKTPAKTKFSSQMKDWLAQGKKLLLDKDISDYDQLVDTKKELDQKLQLKSQQLETTVAELSALRLANTTEIESIRSSTDKRISELVSENKTLFEGFEKRLKSLDIGTNRQKDLEKEVVRLQQELAKVNEKAQSSEAKAIRLEEALFENQNTLVATERDLKATKKDLGSRDRELQGTVSQLESTQADLDAQRRELGLENLDLEDL